jgi:hypothetical protein
MVTFINRKQRALSITTLGVTTLNNAECHNEAHYCGCHYGECRFAECRVVIFYVYAFLPFGRYNLIVKCHLLTTSKLTRYHLKLKPLLVRNDCFVSTGTNFFSVSTFQLSFPVYFGRYVVKHFSSRDYNLVK